jgi:flavin reductase (DIM6/NTAB) family NADH-FMN oxidoreductase RutF
MSEGAASAHRVIDPSVLYVGTPVYLVATQNPDGSANLAPASSHFALARTIVLGLEEGGQSLENVRRHAELTVNFPSPGQWQHVERLAGVTGRTPVPEAKAGAYEYEPDKFGRAGLTALISDLVSAPRVAEAPLQFEAKALRVTEALSGEFAMVEAEVVRVHAAAEITVPGTDHLHPDTWSPLIYAYRHFYARGAEVGFTRKSPFASTPNTLSRWEDQGGVWKVVSVSDTRAEVHLLRCDGGEVVDRIELRDPKEVRWAAVQLAIHA